MAENIKVNQLEIAASLKDNDRVLALTDEQNNEVKTVSKQNVVTSLISKVENNLLTNNGGLYVDGNVITQLLEVLNTLQAQQADEIGRPIFTLSNTLLENEIWLEGKTVSREEYAQLFEVYGEKYGAGDGSTTFKLPDYRKRAVWCDSNFGYMDAAIPNIKGAFTNCDDKYATGAFYITDKTVGSDSGSRPQYVYGFDASRSSTVYKDDCDTVLPPAIKHRVKTRFK